MVAFSMTLSDPNPQFQGFKVTLQFEGKYLANMTSRGFLSDSWVIGLVLAVTIRDGLILSPVHSTYWLSLCCRSVIDVVGMVDLRRHLRYIGYVSTRPRPLAARDTMQAAVLKNQNIKIFPQLFRRVWFKFAKWLILAYRTPLANIWGS